MMHKRILCTQAAATVCSHNDDLVEYIQNMSHDKQPHTTVFLWFIQWKGAKFASKLDNIYTQSTPAA